MDRHHLRSVQQHQDGVISRAQAQTCGISPADIRRLVRRREWARVHPGVFVNHTGPLTWQQRAWAALLYAAPAALCAESALRAANGPGHRGHDDLGPIHVAVASSRTVVTPAGITLHRLTDLDAKTLWNLAPPRLRIEEAVLDVAAGARDDAEAIAVVADAVQSRRTTAGRLATALRARRRIGRRTLLAAVVRDIDEGACSALEHAYLTRVERAHGLPRASRQVRDSIRGPLYRDVVYEDRGLVVELDGRLFHGHHVQRDHDLDRDLDAALLDLQTVRLGWGQVVGRPCVTAPKIGRLLNLRGWTGAARQCARCQSESVESVSPGDPKSTQSA